MRARGSIRAWPELAIGAIVIAAIGALIVAAPWRRSAEVTCLQLNENIALVAGGAATRTSDIYWADVSINEIAAPRATITRGDFSGSWTLDQLRSCLGSEWVESRTRVDAATHGEAWVFVRAGSPLVTYVQSTHATRGELEARIVIDPSPAR